MKNYKLDVVRYNNEDVIATSGSTVDTYADGDVLFYVENMIEDPEAFGYMWQYESGVFSILSSSGGGFTFHETGLVSEGNYYHISSTTGKVTLCNHEGHHGVELPD